MIHSCHYLSYSTNCSAFVSLGQQGWIQAITDYLSDQESVEVFVYFAFNDYH